MRIEWYRSGAMGWFLLFLFVLYWDSHNETLSDAFWRSLDSNWRYLTVPAWAALTVHLFDLVPRKYDVVWQFGRLLFRLFGRWLP